jgi:hypothetical protein
MLCMLAGESHESNASSARRKKKHAVHEPVSALGTAARVHNKKAKGGKH